MNLYRTFSPKRRNSFQFLANQAQQTALSLKLEKQNWIDEIFNRPTPIPPYFASRFGPPGYRRNVFYASERKQTTFFECSFGFLTRASLIELSINAVCYEIRFQGSRPLDVRGAPNLSEILDINPKNYGAAHAWLSSLSPQPKSIAYPSVREPNGSGINYAIFEKSAIDATSAPTEELIITPRASGLVDIESLISGKLPSIHPIY